MVQKFKISAENNNGKAIIRIDGYISQWNNHAKGFRSQLDEIISKGVSDIEVYINTPGGDCFQANEIANELSRFVGNSQAHLGALCASAGTYIASKMNHVKAAKNIAYMIHKPMAEISGNYDEIQAYLKALKNTQDEYAKTYSVKTGLSISEIETMWKEDYWMNADEALKLGFIDEIESEEPIGSDNVNSKISDFQNKLNIAAHSKSDSNSVSRENWTYADWQEKDWKGLAEMAEKEEPRYAVLFEAHFGKSLKQSSIKSSEVIETQETRENWTYADWQEKDWRGLAVMSENNKEKFNKMANSHYQTNKRY